MGANWSDGGWTLRVPAIETTSSGLPDVSNGYAYVSAILPTLRTALLTSQSMATTAYREVAIAWKGSSGSVFYLMMDMANTSPNPSTGGYMLQVENHAGLSTSYLTLWKDGLLVNTATFPAAVTPVAGGAWHLLRLSIDGSNLVRGYWSSDSVPDVTYQLSSYTAAGGQVGFAMGSRTHGIMQVDWFKLTHATAGGGLPPVTLVSSKNGLVYYRSSNGNMVQVNTALTLASDRQLSSVARLDKLYIADCGQRTKSTAGVATTSAGASGVLTDATADFVDTDGVDADDDLLEITAGSWTAGTGLGSYLITAVTATTVTVSGTINAGAGTGVSYRIVRAPKVFDSSALTLTRLTATAGFVPAGCTIVSLCFDRLIWAGDPDNPTTANFSAVGKPTDYLHFDDTPKSAVYFSPGVQTNSSDLGDHVKALIPHEDDYLIIGCAQSTFVLRGDPGLGSEPDTVSRELGIISQFAHCYTPEQVVVALSQDGLYGISPAQNNVPFKISRDRMPMELTNINLDLVYVSMAYHNSFEGINIYVTPKTPGPTAHWWFDWRTKSFHRESYPWEMEPTMVTTHVVDGVSSRVIVLGGRDGLLRVYTEARPDDDGENFESFILIGPIALGASGYYEGILREVVGQLATASGAVTLQIQVGDSVEAAYRAAPRDAFPLLAGKNRTHTPRLRGNACFLRLVGTPGYAWAHEQMSIVRESLGKQRLL